MLQYLQPLYALQCPAAVRERKSDLQKFMTTVEDKEEMVTGVLPLWNLSVSAIKLIPQAKISSSWAAKINERLLCNDKWPSQMRVTAKRHSHRSETLPFPLSCCWGPPGHKRGEMSWRWEESADFFLFCCWTWTKSPAWSGSLKQCFVAFYLELIVSE